MKKAIVLCLLLASFAMSQKYVTVVLPSLAIDPETKTKLTPQQLDILTEDIRDIVAKYNTYFNLMKQDEVKNKLGDSTFMNNCREANCVGDFVSKVDADLGARCDVYIANGQMYMKFELYGTLKGDSIARTIDQFSNEDVKNFADIRAKIKAKVPSIFEKATKSPQQICEDRGKEWTWTNGNCKSSTQIAREACEDLGNTWMGGACKSKAQIACEATLGRKWIGEECKTNEQIDCEKKEGRWENGICKSKAQIDKENCEAMGSVWQNGTCKAPTFTAAPQQASGNYFVARIVTIPAGATLRLNGAPYQGCEKTPCTVSAYGSSVRLSAILNEYKTTDTSFTITQPNQLVTIKLEPRDYTVYFESSPTGALLTINGETNYLCKRTPCNAKFKKGSIKVRASLDLYDAKDTTVSVSVDNQRINLNLTENSGTLNVKPLKGGDDWNLTIDNKSYPFWSKLLPGTYKAKLTNELYEDINFDVEIKKGVASMYDVSDKVVHKYGYLEIKPDNFKWSANIDDRNYNSESLAPLLPGTHKVKLNHYCYEDIDFDVEINRGENTVYDVSDKIKLKKGSLSLYVKYKGRNQKEPVFVDGKEVGTTPFKELVPICAQTAELGNDKERVNLSNLRYSGSVEYTRKLPTWKSTLWSIGIGTVGTVLLYNAYAQSEDASDYAKKYNKLTSGKPLEYDNLKKKANDAHDKVPIFLISGGALVVSAVGVFLWF